eukprot:Protomagalhaensia_wolfi_Nauph_80__863@NODE_149_length_3412_cov_696_803439_g99_i1_p2_GENE_NODE_149_length_3412_cov_696_803439_g99_i1NODE_149_length_3412_cov_696_803439_g99_i1_p2_ORF_typecomplete_len198_score45_18Ank_5/PF13857_6/8_8e03Ank_5/PF13857_6/1_4e11Ank_5/PF13857_6/4_1e06Ank_5/PF13857_6/6_1e12Ank_4/PF13637_6/4_6e02Ank_4/PF13637_6/4_1e14Ank_4/PF13637_6/3e07Ank_2/PF12796_7/3_9e14Ank_2/PF12796_7/1_9e08Ank/PF00023_30/0_00012Ank/PF00023_30/0_027Ank/PF00023_30/6_4e10Ank_3/PF13606_6/7e02Ank_3/PF13
MGCCGGSSVKNDKFSHFSDACFHGNVEKMRETLKKEGGKNPLQVINKPTPKESGGLYPIHRAAQKGKCDAIRFLLDNNADVNVTSAAGETPLHVASFHKNKEAVIELLKSPAKKDLNKAELEHGMTPLHMAIYRGSPEITEILMQAGADPSVRDKQEQDCLSYANFWSQQEEEGMTSPSAHYRQTLEVLQARMRVDA